LTTLGRANLSSTRHGFDIPANIQSEFSGPSNLECDTSWEVQAYKVLENRLSGFRVWTYRGITSIA
jgi:hypothetical protein